MSLPTRLMGHNCEEEIQSIQDALNLVAQHIASIKQKNPDAHLIWDRYTDCLTFVLGTRPVWEDHENGGCWNHEYCNEDLIHRFDDCGIEAAKVIDYSDYHSEYPLRRYW